MLSEVQPSSAGPEQNSINPQPESISVTPNPDAPIDTNPKKSILKSKEFWIVFIICAFLVLLFIFPAAYIGINIFKNMNSTEPLNTFSLPSPTPTRTTNTKADWKTYTGNGYILKYPSNFSVQKDSVKNTQIIISNFDIENKKHTLSLSDFAMTVDVEPKNLTLDQVYNNKISTSETRSEFEIDGEKAIKKIVDYNWGNLKMTYVFTIHKDNMYSIALLTGKSNIANYFDEILFSFKFTDSNSATDTANWKTYTNTRNGYSIKYPADSYINCGKDELSLDESTICAAGEGEPVITVSTNPKSTNYELSEYPNCYKVEKQTISLAEKKAIKYTSIPQAGPNGELPKSECNTNSIANAKNNAEENIILQNGNNTYLLTVHGTFVEKETEQMRNKILSTFKFIN